MSGLAFVRRIANRNKERGMNMSMYCSSCGKQIPDGAAFCPGCGQKVAAKSGIACPKCGSHNVDVQLHQEETGSQTVTTTKSKYKQVGHGCLWWMFIGWWWWMVDLCLWICFFPFKLIYTLTKKKKYKGHSASVTATSNTIAYKTVCLCKDCGYHWEK